MIILGIETSCDETAIALLEADFSASAPQFKVLGHSLHSQVDLHKEYGGVFPMMAKREHTKNLIPLFRQLLKESNFLNNSRKNHSHILKNVRMILEREPELLKAFEEFITSIEKPPIDAIAVTVGPGLEPCLWTGINLAKVLSSVWNIPLVATNHMEGHIYSVLADEAKEIKYPALALLISGGHTELVLAEKPMQYKIIGQTRDDAVGEAFDKIARILGLPYPGGPEISKLAEKTRFGGETSKMVITLPRPMIHSDNFDFSFSGLKTSVLYLVKKLGALDEKTKQEIARETEDAIVDVLVSKTRKALEHFGAQSLIIGGGVIANKTIRKAMEKLGEEFQIPVHIPSQALSTDNAIMIAIAGAMHFRTGKISDPTTLKALGNLSLS